MRKTLYLFLLAALISQNKSQICDVRLSIDISDGTYNNDSAIVYNNITYNVDQYYLEQARDHTYIIGCPCKVRTCYRKCCKRGELLTTECVQNEKSQNYSERIQIFDYKTPLDISVEQNFIEVHDITCPSGQVAILDPRRHNIFLQKNGSLLYGVQGYEFWVPPEEFCMEMYDREDFKELAALICLQEVIEDNTSTTKLYAYLMLISLPFLLVTYLIYRLTPELRNLHGKCLANYVLCVFIAFLFLVVVYLSGRTINMTVCVLSAIITYVSYMASFLWLNVMCFDLWLKFSGRRYNKTKNDAMRTYSWYNIYVWGVAGLCLFIVVFLQFYGPKNLPNAVLPQIGVQKCWFPDSYIQGYYMYGPMLFLIVVNTILFILTANNIQKLKKEAKKSVLSDNHKQPTANHQRFGEYLKLFLAFGINWSFELIPWLIGIVPPIQLYLDIINLLYGIIIFYISVCKKSVIIAVKKRISSIFCPRRYLTRANTEQLSLSK